MKNLNMLIITVMFVFCLGCSSKKTVTVVNSCDITGKYWKLIELNGVRVSAEIMQTPYIMLTEGQISGAGGCNQFSGSYTIDKNANFVRFSGIIMTQKACFAENVDNEFAKVIEMTDNYSISPDGKYLTLNRLKMAPLAVFELGDFSK
ncbi:MAG: META domain-containing protein [Paludibacter sp.]|nr:META domain-containing protein [Paludibacter sp.]